MDLKWYAILIAMVAYMALSWLLLWLCNEEVLTSADFLYWIVVTASTVGYGDFSPQTEAGKYVVSLFVIPFGLGLFGLVIGRLAAYISFQWRKGVQGLRALNLDKHILVIGWNEDRTLQLIRLLLREMDYHAERTHIALCVKADIENPMPDRIGFVKVKSYTDDQEMERAAIGAASCIIIDSRDDDVTMTTALYCAGKNADAHIIAYFRDDRLGDLLKTHCPNIECMPSVTVEMIAKSAVDPGSSGLHHQLLAVDKGMTQYSVKYAGRQSTLVRDLFLGLKEQYQATLIGVSDNGYESLRLNPAMAETVQPGDTLYYIADERINNIRWEDLP